MPTSFRCPTFRVLALLVACLIGPLWCSAEDKPKNGTTKSTNGDAPSPDASLAAVKTPADLKVELVLAEPIVRQPVFINFDERGRLWVVQYLQYPALFQDSVQ